MSKNNRRILAASYPVLNRIVATIKRANVQHVTVEGHTDSKDSEAYNRDNPAGRDRNRQGRPGAVSSR